MQNNFLCEILRTEVGSTLHGISDGWSDDIDQMGIAIENSNCITGLQTFEQYIYRSAEDNQLPQGKYKTSPRSQAGDLDLCIYGLKKWMRLATQGNPSILLPLFAPED